jgi:hypothetical protein
MKNSSVTIKGLTRIQANALALLCEDEAIGKLINEKMDEIKSTTEEGDELYDLCSSLEDEMASMDFDDSDGDVNHVADFGA